MLETLDLQFKESIKYGMSYEQFWYDCPELYYIYEEAYKDTLKEKDIMNWQLGQYILYAIGNCFADKGKVKYPEKPIFFAHEEEKPKTVFDMREKFMSMVAQVNKKFD